ncbi:hypothetical protein RYX36_010046 [Vicia faba]
MQHRHIIHGSISISPSFLRRNRVAILLSHNSSHRIRLNPLRVSDIFALTSLSRVSSTRIRSLMMARELEDSVPQRRVKTEVRTVKFKLLKL